MTGAQGNQVVNGGALRPSGGGEAGGGVLDALPEGGRSIVQQQVDGRLLGKVQQVNGSIQGLNMAAVPTSTAQPGMQIVNMRPAQGNLLQPQQVRSLAPRMIINSQMIQNARAGQPGVSLLCLLIYLHFIMV